MAVLGAMSLGFRVFAGLVVGKGAAYRPLATAITTVACFGVGLLTTAVVVLVMRHLARRAEDQQRHGGWRHAFGGLHRRHHA